MGPYLSLPGARIFALMGWGKVINSDTHDYQVELADVGQFVVSKPGLLRDKTVVSIPIAQLSLGTYTRQITHQENWVGGGFGVTGMLLGVAQARLLNRMTTHAQEYSVLSATAELPNGAKREALLGFVNVDESELRDRVLGAIPRWVEAYVATVANELNGADPLGQDLRGIHGEIDRMLESRLVHPADASALRGRASEPFVAALLQRLRQGSTSQSEAHRIKAEIDQLQSRGWLAESQAQQIAVQLAPILSPSPDRSMTEAERRRVNALAALHGLGAMSQAQFETEKARLLGADE